MGENMMRDTDAVHGVSTEVGPKAEERRRPRRSLGRSAAGLVAALALLAAGLVVTSGVAAAAPASAGTLSLGVEFSSVNFDPWQAPDGDNASAGLNEAVYDSVTTLKGNGIAPDLATSWAFPSPTTLVLHLRPGVKFGDGTPVDAAAVKANFDYAKTASPAGQLNTVFTGTTSTVVNPTTLQLSLPTPNPDLLYDLATGAGFIVNPKALANPATLQTTPDGSGPYTLSASASVPGQQYTFVRKPSYWNLASYPYKTVVVKIFASPQAQDDALRSGQIQAATVTPTSAATDTSANVRIIKGQMNGLVGVWLADRAGTITKALGNVQVRQALNFAINRKAIIKVAGGTSSAPGSLVSSPSQAGFTGAAAGYYSYNPAKARRLLAAAGYPHGFTLKLLSTPEGDTLVQATAGYLRAVGVNVQISDHATDFVTQALSGKWPALVFEWSTVPQVSALVGLLSPTGLGNPNHSTDPTIDAQLTQVQTTTGATQTAALKQLVSTVNQQGWFLLAGYSRPLQATSTSVTCSMPGGLGGCPLYTFRPAR
jgi:peptide/nickel transport system substrate-binding protein